MYHTAGWEARHKLSAGMLSHEQLPSLLSAECDAFGAAMPQEAYLYHTVRRDLRHNFSPLYYTAYLNLGDAAPSALLGRWLAGDLVRC